MDISSSTLNGGETMRGVLSCAEVPCALSSTSKSQMCGRKSGWQVGETSGMVVVDALEISESWLRFGG